MKNEIRNIDCLQGLKELPDNSIDCCVTSPPYFGLRDYGSEGQIGLEETPEKYVQKLVEVFTEVKRVLKPTGTLWLNLGDSYANTGCNSSQVGGFTGERIRAGKKGIMDSRPRKIPEGIKPKDLIGIPWMVAFALRSAQRKHLVKSEADRAYIAGLVDGEGCITILRTKSSHCQSYSYPPIVQIRMCDIEAVQDFANLTGVGVSNPELPPSHKANNQRASYNVKVTADKAMKLIADIYPYLRVKRKQAIVAYNHQLLRSKTNYQPRSKKQIEQEEFCKDLINRLNQREQIDLPSWMIEPVVEEESGWYLRQDCIWHKPNPMPESVTDRCTKSHEYIFLMSKSAKYYYDADSIRTEQDPTSIKRLERGWNGDGMRGYPNGPQNHIKDYMGKSKEEIELLNGANKRSVWTVTTKPFSEAHFATFPEDLISDCIKAGCPEGGIVLDPFMGAGTTALVAKKLNRNYLGFELNPEYIKIAEKRLFNALGLFNDVE